MNFVKIVVRVFSIIIPIALYVLWLIPSAKDAMNARWDVKRMKPWSAFCICLTVSLVSVIALSLIAGIVIICIWAW